ncbi:unnamed protein product [Linum tenue]|uniref:Protein kinase domain-containing protein n=1 Tax=Linum tenue TaxID=586396 RepID=A0AAV0NP03_9ROSI|nr:unnamed protein product [Linum tenue]
MNRNLGLGFFVLLSFLSSSVVNSQCNRGCDLALASYYVWEGSNLTYILQLMKSNILRETDFDALLSYNRQIPNKDSVQQDTRINVPFPCECINGQLLGHVFLYPTVTGDTYDLIAGRNYANLTTVDWLRRFNSYPPNNIPDRNAVGDTLESIARGSNVSADLLQRYNAGANFSSGRDLVFVPGRDASNSYRPLNSSSSGGISGGLIAGISIAAVAVVLLLAVCVYVKFYRKKKKVAGTVQLPALSLGYSAQGKLVIFSFQSRPGAHSDKPLESPSGAASGGLTGITVDKSVEFSYEELAKATDDFSLANKIGAGGFGTVYYAELRGEKAAIKKMDMQASKEFFAELKVLNTCSSPEPGKSLSFSYWNLSLSRLIGYCVEGSLFLVYEFIENGNLSQHLRSTGEEGATNVAWQSANCTRFLLEALSISTSILFPVYIHRDIKSANILIDKNYRAKVADFGLTKLTEVGSTSLPTRLVGNIRIHASRVSSG